MSEHVYRDIDPITRAEAGAVLERDDPDELRVAVLAVALHEEDRAVAEAYALRLATHPHAGVRGCAVMGLGHIARLFGALSPDARAVVWAALEDTDDHVRSYARNASDDVEIFVGPRVAIPPAAIIAFLALPPGDQRRIHLALCRDALATWTAYVASGVLLEYRDAPMGLRHEVDPDLPADALRSAEAGRDLADVYDRYSEPMKALQDGDLWFPGPVRHGYDALYNGFLYHACGAPVDPWLIVQLALACPPSPADRFARAVRNAAEA